MSKQSLTGHGGNKLRSYRLFKKEFDIEPYLLNVRSTTLHVSMTRLRVGCHSLEIERGRYHKPQSIPVCQRLCEKCNMIEDEIFISCVCVPSIIHYMTNLNKQYKWTFPDTSGYHQNRNLFIYWNHLTRLLTMQLHISYTMLL